ncbi:hypothetical protein KEM48_008953 [Puccinia striiformis f. sp. tritici PST-130]|nr:hypothetical protein KEM48_008953 [Puccinia striiformis f. sp. tritici PST-130]
MSESNPSTSSTTSEPAKDSEIRFRQPLVIDLKVLSVNMATTALATSRVYIPELVNLHSVTITKPEDIRRDPGSKLTRLSELQLAIDHSMTRVAYSMALICPRPLHTFDRVDDHKLERFKSFWLNKLVEIHEFMEDTVCEFMEGRGSPVYAGSIYIPSAFINSTIKLRSESELTVAIRLWKLGAHMMPKQLRQASEAWAVHQIMWKFGAAFKEGLPLIRDEFEQLRCLCNSACNVSFDLSGLVDLLQTAERSLPANLVDTRNFTEVVQTLASRFEALLLLFRTYLVPLIRQTDQDHYKNWFAIWDTQFTLAVIRFQTSLDHRAHP